MIQRSVSSWLFFFLLVLGLVMPHPALAQKLIVGLDPWQPFSGDDLPGKGLSAEVIRQVFEHASYAVDIRIMPWARVESLVKSGDIDVMGNLYHIPEIAQWAAYSEPYYQSRVKLIALADLNIQWHALEDLKRFRIGVGNGYSFGSKFDNATYLNKQTIPLSINGLNMLLVRRLDLVIDSEEVLLFHLNTQLAGQKQRFKLLEPPIITNAMSIGVSRQHPRHQEIIAAFNQSFQVLKAQGIIDQLITRHISTLHPEPTK